MKLLLSWLQEFVSVPAEPRRLADELTMLGLAVDSVTTEDGETVFEIDVTTNRPDCLSHYGVARELAVRHGTLASSFPNTLEGKPRARRRDPVVAIPADDLCRRYSARILRGVTVGPSPEWLARRLERVGIRSINNVADATNYILMAFGHPLHAFDLDRLTKGCIVVRRAEEGEPLRTLDGVERRLTSADLVIADAKRPVALAGIMGGSDTEISPGTKNVLLESAWFEPVAVRRTSKKQGLHTEASHRFERGADIGATLAAANRCIELIRELAGGELDPHVADVYPKPAPPQTILLRRAELARHLGMEIPAADVERILGGLGFAPRARGRAGWGCVVPTHRVDVSREIDLVEEVARHYGYDRFPLSLPPSSGQPARKAPQAAKEERLRSLLLGLGYDETLSAVLVSQATERFGDAPPVALSNPLSEEASILRTSVVPSLLSAVQWNRNRGQETARLFEIGNVYLRNGSGYREPPVLGLVATGDRVEADLNQPPRKFDWLDLKGDVERCAELFETGPVRFDADGLPDYYRAGHRMRLVVEGAAVAWLGQLSLEVAEQWKFRQPVYLAEVFLERLYARDLRLARVRPISRFPAVERDFSLLLPRDVRFDNVREAVLALGITELVAVAPVETISDRPPATPERYSLLLRLTLQSFQATLTETELAAWSARLIQCLEGTLGAQVRM
ncbi:MAG: phenylalanine--tRNA ligase subunit beta [Terriglobia bacterium]